MLDRIYVDLLNEPLAEPNRVFLFSDKATADAFTLAKRLQKEVPYLPQATTLVPGKVVLWDSIPWTIINIGVSTVTLLSNEGIPSEIPKNVVFTLIQEERICCPKVEDDLYSLAYRLLQGASPDDLSVAVYRYQQINSLVSNETESIDNVPARTLRLWKKQYRDAEQAYGNGFIGLLPFHGKKGNRTKKLPNDCLEKINEFIIDKYEMFIQKNKLRVYSEFCLELEKLGIPTASYKTFAKLIKLRPKEKQVRNRQGDRAAYPYEQFYWQLEMTTPRHGDRPFEIGHIDHTPLDLELLHSTTQKNMGKAWLTILMDAYTRSILAFHIDYDPPSKRSVMNVIRECVRRHNRLPETIVVDGGREFRSVYFESLLAYYQINKLTRPSAKARFGSVCERLFGTTTTQLINNLAGNTQITKEVRKVTKKNNPKNLAKYSILDLYELLALWAYELYDTAEHSALGQSPREAFALGMRRSGTRPFRFIPYNKEFIILTLPTTDKGTAMVHESKGVKINNFYYHNSQFASLRLEGKQVPVRFDPYNMGIAYAYVNLKWEECVSQYYSQLAGRSLREIQLLSAELKKQGAKKDYYTSSKQIVDALVAKENQLNAQRIRDLERIRMFELIEGGKTSVPVEAVSFDEEVLINEIPTFDEY